MVFQRSFLEKRSGKGSNDLQIQQISIFYVMSKPKLIYMNEFNFLTGLLACGDAASLELAEALLSRSTNATLLKNIHKHLSGMKAADLEKEILERKNAIENQLSHRLGL
jgi:hypothetical protein